MPRSGPCPRGWTTATARRSVTSTRTWSGQARETSTLLTAGSASTRAVTASRSAVASGEPRGTAAARRTAAGDSTPVPATWTPETARTEEKKTVHTATATTPSSSRPTTSRRHTDQRRAHWRRANRLRATRTVRSSALAARVGHRGRRAVAVVGSRCTSLRARSSSSTSGPTSVTSPAPRVSTRSPGRARSTRAAGVADQDGSKCTCSAGSGTCEATSRPLTPGSGSSRAT